MSELDNMLEKVKIDEIIAYLMYGTDSEIERSETYDKRLKNAFDKIFETLESMFPSVNRHDDTLWGAVMDFSITHNEVYLEMGLIIGFQIYKNMEHGFKDFKTNDINATIKKILHADRETEKNEAKKDSLLKALFDERMDYALETSLRTDEKYKKARQTVSKQQDKLDNIGLSKEQWKATDRAISAYNALSAEYGRAAYEQGFKDSMKLISELYRLI